MDQNTSLEESRTSGQISNFEIKQELDDTEFNIEELHHSIDIKEESSFLEPEQIKCECRLCGIHFYDNSHLTKHLETQCLVKPFSCKICAFRCLTKLQLNRHRKTHIGLATIHKYVRKTARQSWSEENMKLAITEVIEGKMGYVKASRTFGIPQSTLIDRVKKTRSGDSVDEASKKGSGRYMAVFTAVQEDELASHILKMESRLFDLTLSDFRRLAFELADKNKLAHRFNGGTGMAGETWLYGFLRRHQNLSLWSSEATSIGRAIGFNRSAVNKFFSVLTETFEKYKFTPECIWNVDETGITTVPNEQSKIIGLRGKKQVSAESGTLVTAEICMNAAGGYMPTMLIFPQKQARPELLDDTPPGTTAEFHPSGSIQKDFFIRWFKRFIATANPSAQKPMLLLLDGHATHTKSIELINLARENYVTLLCFPPHCTHQMQPLDVSFMASLRTYYEEETSKWLYDHPGRSITINQVGKLFGIAFTKAASVQTAVNGFKKTGIYPLNPGVYEDWMFGSSDNFARNEIVTDEESYRTCKPLENFMKTDLYDDDVNDGNSPDKKLKIPDSMWKTLKMSSDCGKRKTQEDDEKSVGMDCSDDDISQTKFDERNKKKQVQNKIRCRRYRVKKKSDAIEVDFRDGDIRQKEIDEKKRKRKLQNKISSQRYRDKKKAVAISVDLSDGDISQKKVDEKKNKRKLQNKIRSQRYRDKIKKLAGIENCRQK